MTPEEQEIRQHASALAVAVATENQAALFAALTGLLARFLIDLNRLATAKKGP